MKTGLAFLLTFALLGAGAAVLFFIAPPAQEPSHQQALAPATQQKSIPLPDACLNLVEEDGCLQPSALRGRIVVFNFWASWCPPCVVEFPFLLDTVKNAGGKIALLTLSHDHDGKSILRFRERFLSDYEETLQSSLVYWTIDGGQKVSAEIFGVYKVPETFVVDPQGQIVRKIVGPVDQAKPPLYDTLVALDPSLKPLLSRPKENE
jgi:thiol-disulfide isomerase/thioredoxin